MSNGRFGAGTITDTNLCYDEGQQLFVGDVNNDTVDDVIMHWVDASTNRVNVRVSFGGSSDTLSVENTHDTVTSCIISGDIVYRVHVGDVNGSGTDIITETARSDFAYRSKVFINRGYPTEFDPMTIQLKLRTYFYIDYQ